MERAVDGFLRFVRDDLGFITIMILSLYHTSLKG